MSAQCTEPVTGSSGNAHARREVARDKIAIISRRGDDDAVGIELGHDVKNGRERHDICFALEHGEIIAALENLARLRAQLEPLRRGALASLWVEEKQYVFARSTANASSTRRDTTMS